MEKPEWTTLLHDIQLGTPYTRPSLIATSISAQSTAQHHAYGQTFDSPQLDTIQDTIVVVSPQPLLLHLVHSGSVQCTWKFQSDITSFCWNVASKDQPYPGVIVLTNDGSIWSLSVASPQPAKSSIAEPSTSTFKSHGIKDDSMVIMISSQDSESDNRHVDASLRQDFDEMDEIELWNDEDGLLSSLDKIDSTPSPQNKRQRTLSPPRSMTTTHDRTQESLSRLVHADALAITFAFNGLLVFFPDKDPIHLKSDSHFMPGTTVQRKPTSISFRPTLQAGTTLCFSTRPSMEGGIGTGSEGMISSKDLYVGTFTGTVLRVYCSQSSDGIVLDEICSESQEILQEPVVGLFPVTLGEKDPLGNTNNILVIVGAHGNIYMKDMAANQRPVMASIGASIQGAAFTIDKSLYLQTTEDILLRLPMTQPGTFLPVERAEVPTLYAIAPKESNSGRVEGFVGLDSSGQVLSFPMGLSRDNLDLALSDLRRVSERVKALEVQCQPQGYSTYPNPGNQDHRQGAQKNGGDHGEASIVVDQDTAMESVEKDVSLDTEVSLTRAGTQMSPIYFPVETMILDALHFAVPLKNLPRGWSTLQQMKALTTIETTTTTDTDAGVFYGHGPSRQESRHHVQPVHGTIEQALDSDEDLNIQEGNRQSMHTRCPDCQQKRDQERRELEGPNAVRIRKLEFNFDKTEIDPSQVLAALLYAHGGISDDRVKDLLEPRPLPGREHGSLAKRTLSTGAAMSIPEECVERFRPPLSRTRGGRTASTLNTVSSSSIVGGSRQVPKRFGPRGPGSWSSDQRALKPKRMDWVMLYSKELSLDEEASASEEVNAVAAVAATTGASVVQGLCEKEQGKGSMVQIQVLGQDPRRVLAVHKALKMR
ncbi:hypothetical protein BGW38_004139, partial [Lunasporangiospora selenospora]